MHSVIVKYANLSSTWKAKMKVANDRVASSGCQCTEAEAKLQEELIALRSRVKEALGKEHARSAKMVAKFDHYEVLHQLAKGRAQESKDRARIVE